MDVEVLIVGAGPNGLMLACELALGGVRAVVIEQDAAPGGRQRANGLIGQVVRMMDRRGLLERLGGVTPPQPAPAFIFGGYPLDLGGLDDNPVYTLGVPQARIEQVLEERARELGVEIRRGVALTGFTQRADGVRVETTGSPVEVGWLVGADGGRSVTRKLAGIDFPGTTDDRTVSRTAHVTVPPEFVDAATGGLIVPGYGVVPAFLHHRTEQGLVTWAPFPGRPPMVSVSLREDADESVPMTLAELRAALRRVTGGDVPFGEPDGPGPHLMRRLSGGNTRIASAYRSGRVLLLGDAAHVHSAIGGPGLNLGLQDAVNLGWKLAAQVRGDAPTGLLDTYESERRPAALRVTMQTEAQGVLVGPGPQVTALRTLFGELLQEPAVRQRIAGLISGADIRYDGMGPWAPDLRLDNGSRLAELTRRGRPLLLDMTPGKVLGGPWGARIDVVTAQCDDPAVTAMLLRPDCYVAWSSGDAEPDTAGLTEAIDRWFGV